MVAGLVQGSSTTAGISTVTLLRSFSSLALIRQCMLRGLWVLMLEL